MKKLLFQVPVAALTALTFFFSSCTNSIGSVSEDTNAKSDGNMAVQSGISGDSLVAFTGNPAYDITLLNNYWAKNGTPFQGTATSRIASVSASRSLAADGIQGPLLDTKEAAINGFGDMVKNFSGKSLLTWAGGTALSGTIGAVAGVGVTYLLDALGIVKSTSSYLKEISGKLDKIDKQLATMQTMLTEMETKLYSETKLQGELTRYYTVMQNRDNQYNNIYTDAMICWNSIIDVLFEAAVASQYQDDAAGYTAKIAELNTKEKKLSYLSGFIDSASWENATAAADVALTTDAAGAAFKKYFEDNAQTISEKIEAKVKAWGANTSTGASSVFKLCKYLTDTNKGTANDSFNMYQLYDKYAEVCFVWEQEGYSWRQAMRDQDSALIAMSATLAYWYYALTETLHASSTNCSELLSHVNAALALNTNYPIVRHSTPIYQKWGSKWQGQTFTGTLAQIDYTKVMSSKWATPSIEKGSGSKVAKKNILEESNYRYNASRLYAGLGPKAPPSDANTICTEAQNMAMPEEWYKEIFDAYAVSSSKGVTHKALFEIFKSVGFTNADGSAFTFNTVTAQDYEDFFITNRRTYMRVATGYNAGNWHEYCPFVTVVVGNSSATYEQSGHEACPVVYVGRYVYHVSHYGKTSHYTDISDSYKVCKKTLTNRVHKFYYPVKTDTAVVAN
ncbi:hypothetical protein [uncultured Treponema sp.]|uniref:hypothetical protein n=1 Tax=uncultured Treponema sp. TaxID=162155 RepID=UPI00260025DE|nr:hypothetical protein [uncultured Treponema sp.]